MRLTKSVFNPLPLILELATVGLPMTKENVEHLGTIFEKAGIETESTDEVIALLRLLATEYNIITFDNSNNKYSILRTANG